MFAPESLQEGVSHPRGATPTEHGVNFTLFPAHATRVEVCIFDDAGGRVVALSNAYRAPE
jgi:isoamylase